MLCTFCVFVFLTYLIYRKSNASYKFVQVSFQVEQSYHCTVGCRRADLWKHELWQAKKKKVDIKLERKRSIMKYHVEGRGESDLKARILYRLCWRRRALKFLQNGQSSLRSIWTTTVSVHRVVSLTLPSMGAKPFICRTLNCVSNNGIQPFIFF